MKVIIAPLIHFMAAMKVIIAPLIYFMAAMKVIIAVLIYFMAAKKDIMVAVNEIAANCSRFPGIVMSILPSRRLSEHGWRMSDRSPCFY